MTKKRFFASVLALFLLLSCVALPTPAYAEGEEAPSNGLELSKTVTANENGTYTITMESYTTGTVISGTKTVPVDIVLVLDQSGSMSDGFGSTTRQAAMKTGVNNFIAAVAEKYSDEADHRMAIVTFGSGAKTLQGWTFVDATGKTTLQGIISGLPKSPSGATNVDAGMGQAETLMGSGYNYTGKNTPRQKVVIVFTDGVPTKESEFDIGVANDAIASAKNLKDSGATVYTVGIFNGANPNELYGASGFDTNSDGTVNSQWIKETWGWFPGTDFPETDRPAGNRFLNYLSSNYPNATSIGLTRATRGLGIFHYKITYTITGNYAPAANNYYLTAKDSGSLNEIFKTIANNIQTAKIDLGKDTVVKDTVTKYFDLPKDKSDIKVYTADAKADGSFEKRVEAPDLTPNIMGNAVTVTGFDFNANFVSDKLKDDKTYGKKLIVEFTVTPKNEFIGGNDVPTNDWQNTGVYNKDGALVENFNDANTTPKVNVPVKDPDFTTADKTIYLGNSTEVSGLYTLQVGDTTGWQYDYVNVEVDGVTGTEVTPEDCTEYDIKVTFKPKTDGTKAVGTANSMDGKSKTEKATVHVLKPNATVTLNDVARFYGDSYTLGEGNNAKVSLEWKDMTADHTDIPEAEGTAPYTKDKLTVEYEAQGITVTGNQFTVPKDDVTITVKLMNGEEQIKDAVITTTCSLGCETTSRKDGTYIVHVKTATLIIQKSGASGTNEGFIFNVKGPENFRVSVKDNGTVKITGLPLGTYTVTEETGWSWRYQSVSISNNGSVNLTKDSDTATVTVTNSNKNTSLLDGNAYVQNISKPAAGN
ncbi:MAG: vWA domain-containing protein [Candidatus Limivicinus sp.]|nr:vWA domain-containing protein [Candidatus Limivicinus sp.]